MSNKRGFIARTSGCRGLTLLELLIVASILAAIAFIATGMYTGVRTETDSRLVRTEMQEIAKAIRQFKQDTGYYPKTGPFNLVGHDGGLVPYGNLPSYVGANADLWFYSPANFHQLVSRVSPLRGTGHPLEKWNPETGRGWRGPYLRGHTDGYLDIRSGISDGTPAGNSNGYLLDGGNIPDVEGIADPFEYPALRNGGDTILDWSVSPGGTERNMWGRPYLVFDWNTKPWLVSMGPDGEYTRKDPADQGYPYDPESDDIVLPIE